MFYQKKSINLFLFCVVLFLQIQSSPLQAQTRVILNSNFETPVMGVDPTAPCIWGGAPTCAGNVHENNFPSWNTTATDNQIEVWTSGYQGFNTHPTGGNQFVELNANQAAAAYVDVCIFSGESLTLTFLHRARAAGTDEMQVSISPIGGALVTLGANVVSGNTWTTHVRNYTNSGTSGVFRIQFRAIRTASGNNTEGNFLDNILITGLNPIVEFAAANYSSPEITGGDAPRVLINGIIPAGGATVDILATGGSATNGTDFSHVVTLAIPTGNYDGSFAMSLPMSLTVIDDPAYEGNETIIYTLANPTSNLTINDANCDGTILNSTTYTILDDDTILPITLTYFKAVVDKKENVIIKWGTSSEVDNDYFLVEHSLNGKHWKVIAQVKGANTNSQSINYSITDTKASNGINYYRLKQIDYDGTTTTSRAVSVNLHKKIKSSILVYPNPVQDELLIQIQSDEKLQSIQVIDMLGKQYQLYQTFTQQKEIYLDTSNLSDGVYFVSLQFTNTTIDKKIIVQH